MRFQTIFEFCLQSKINLQVKLKFLVNTNSSLNNLVYLDQSSFHNVIRIYLFEFALILVECK